MNHKAAYWEYDSATSRVNCYLCPHYCKIKEGNLGLCKTRKNIDNTLYAINYGKVASAAIDPIEKKPLYHFYPGTKILSFGTYGCNMRCSFCQNYSISQYEAPTKEITPEEVYKLIEQQNDTMGIAFTYNEPFMWYEFMADTFSLIKAKDPNIKTVAVTNGYINQEPLLAILPSIDAMNIDLKTFREQTYKKLCGARLEPVKQTILLAQKHCHIEITTLMVTGENDTIFEVGEIAAFIGGINKDIPLHLTRYYPNYKMDRKATDIQLIQEAKKAAEKYLNYVYLGNIGNIDSNTYCPNCHKTLIERHYYDSAVFINSPQCPDCKTPLPIIF